MNGFLWKYFGSISMAGSKKYYAVIRGVKPGIYNTWYGPDGAEIQVKGYENALFRGFTLLEGAKRWIEEMTPLPDGDNTGHRTEARTGLKAKRGDSPKHNEASPAGEPVTPAVPPSPQTVIYTDGGCRRNPGPGGYGAVILEGNSRREISRGFRLTTNNRMELLACIEALKSLHHPSEVLLYSDSRYVVNGIEKGWAKKWQRNGWMRTAEEPALNADLWSELLNLCTLHRVRFVWVRGHAGNSENERCDSLATGAALSREPAEDYGYLKQAGVAPVSIHAARHHRID